MVYDVFLFLLFWMHSSAVDMIVDGDGQLLYVNGGDISSLVALGLTCDGPWRQMLRYLQSTASASRGAAPHPHGRGTPVDLELVPEC